MTPDMPSPEPSAPRPPPEAPRARGAFSWAPVIGLDLDDRPWFVVGLSAIVLVLCGIIYYAGGMT